MAGAVYNPNTSGGNTTAAFNAVVSNLVIRNLIENLRSKPVLAQMGNYSRAKNVPGTKGFVYTAFGDLSPAVALLEGVPPETEKLQFDSASFFGSQKGKLVAITDLADLISPFDLYSIAAEKVAWNIIDTLEKDLAALLSGADNGIGITSAKTTAVGRIIDTVTAMKIAEVPMFPDQTYHAEVSPDGRGHHHGRGRRTGLDRRPEVRQPGQHPQRRNREVQGRPVHRVDPHPRTTSPSSTAPSSSRGATTRPSSPTGSRPVATTLTRWPSVGCSAGRGCGD